MKLKNLITVAGLTLSFGLFFGLSANAADGTTMETATTLSLDGEAQKNSMTVDNSVYWYKCTIPSDIGNKWVTFSCTNSLSDMIEYAVYNDEEDELGSYMLDSKESGNVICKVPDSGSTEDLPLVEPGKTYYIKAEGNFSEKPTGKYALQITSKADDNWGTAEQAAKATVGKKTSGTLEAYDDIDYFQFTIPEFSDDAGEGVLYTLALAGTNNCTATILTEDEIDLDSVSCSEDGKFSESLEVNFSEGGTYYLKISDANPDVKSTSYSFKLTKGQSSETLSADTSNTSSSTTTTAKTKKTIKTLGIIAKRNAKTITIASLKGGKFKVTLKRKIIISGKKKVKTITKTVKSGKLVLKLSTKLKTGDTVKVTVSKSGYKTKTVTTKVK
ncbi:MAG: hypothetical protein IJ733_05215 [Lachnospiraceae bacterium]|nr:hypothetical protein [Lachnospiraceae bacterium]